MNGVRDKLNRPLRDLRISVTDQCNFRCAYCMPAEIFGPDYAFLPRSEQLADDEIILLAKAFTHLGIEKIRITGGEPLLRRSLDQLIARLHGETGVVDITLTTNGSLLPRHAKNLKAAGLERINISLDSLDKERFAQMNGNRSTPEAVLKGINAAEAAGLHVKVNMVAQRGVNETDILPMIRYFRERRMTLRFIEYMDVGETNRWKLDQVVPAKQILDTIASEFRFEPIDPSYRGEVAKRYRYLDTDCEFGIITSISQPFCQDCNRARLSADGKLYTCLFATEGTDLKKVLRSGADLDDMIAFVSKIWGQRDDQYSDDRAKGKPITAKKVEMSYIGG